MFITGESWSGHYCSQLAMVRLLMASRHQHSLGTCLKRNNPRVTCLSRENAPKSCWLSRGVMSYLSSSHHSKPILTQKNAGRVRNGTQAVCFGSVVSLYLQASGLGLMHDV